MEIREYSLVYCAEDGKLHIGDACTEVNESLVGGMTDEIYESENYTGKDHCLTLDNFSFATSADIALVLPDKTTVYLKGKNELKVVNDKGEANVAVLYSDGDMTITGDEDGEIICLPETKQGLWSRCVCARFGDLRVEGGTVCVFAGESKKSCGLYAGGRLFKKVEGTGMIRITGGTVFASAKTNAVRASEGLLIVEAPEGQQSVVVNAKEFAGGTDAHTGSALTQEESMAPLVITFRPV